MAMVNSVTTMVRSSKETSRTVSLTAGVKSHSLTANRQSASGRTARTLAYKKLLVLACLDKYFTIIIALDTNMKFENLNII